MIKVADEFGNVYEIGCEVRKTEDSCSFLFEYTMECVLKESPASPMMRESAKMMAEYCEMLYYSEGRGRCFGVMPVAAAEYVLMELLEKKGYKVEAFPEEDDSTGYDENGNQIIY